MLMSLMTAEHTRCFKLQAYQVLARMFWCMQGMRAAADRMTHLAHILARLAKKHCTKHERLILPGQQVFEAGLCAQWQAARAGNLTSGFKEPGSESHKVMCSACAYNCTPHLPLCPKRCQVAVPGGHKLCSLLMVCAL